MRITFFLVIALGLVSALRAQGIGTEKLSALSQRLIERYGPDYPVGPDPRQVTPPVERLKKDANDAYAIREYAKDIVQSIEAEILKPELLSEDLQAANKKLDELEEFLQALPAATSAAKAAIAGAKQTAKTAREIVTLRETPLVEFRKQVLDNPGDAMAIGYFRTKFRMELEPLAIFNPDEAAKGLDEMKRVVDRVEESAPTDDKEYSQVTLSPKWQLERTRIVIAMLEKMIQSSKEQMELLAQLIGTDAVRLEVDAWVNGSPLRGDDLNGKVVLLDFWSAWCTPCLATFPKLREWDEKYRDKGLVTIAVTSYYNQRWDHEAKESSRIRPNVEKIPHIEEREMVANLAQKFGLKFRFAIQDKETHRSLCEFYGGHEIPRVVVIDQEGKIRLIRAGQACVVGQDTFNAKGVGEMLEMLLAASHE